MFVQHKLRPYVWHGQQEVHQPCFLRKGWFTQKGLVMATRYVDALIMLAWGLTVFFGTMYVKGPKLFKRRRK
jgi:hypothetical protein